MRPTAEEIRSIYAGIESVPGLKFDIQGWNSTTPIFDEVIFLTQSKVIVEVGSWNGASAIHMLQCCRKRGLDTTLYACDLFPGLVGDGIGETPASQIPRPWNRPTRHQQFLFNIKAASFDDRVIPILNFSYWTASILASWGVQADLIYIDGDHRCEPVYADLASYWPLLRSGGILFGDDIGYPGVLAAIGRFGLEKNISLNIVGGQYYWRKP